LANLNESDRQAPLAKDISNAANTLDLVAVCYDATIIDQDIVKRIFRNKYISFYDQIAWFQWIDALNKSGNTLLNEKPVVGRIYSIFKNYTYEQDRIGKS
jgi:hypothetical protein